MEIQQEGLSGGQTAKTSIHGDSDGQMAMLIVPATIARTSAAPLAGHDASANSGRGGSSPARRCHASECMYQLVSRSIREWVRLTALYNAERLDSSSSRAVDVNSTEATTTSAAATRVSAAAESDARAGREVDVVRGGGMEANRPLDQLRHLRHTLITCVSTVCPEFDGLYRCPLEQYLPLLLPPLLAALEDRDPDTSRQARGCAELASNTPLLLQVLPTVLQAVRCVSTSPSWQVRSSVLPVLQVVIFRHQCTIADADKEMVRSLMVSLLQDPQVEVREMASSAVAVLVRICGEELALKLKDDFCEWSRQKLPEREGRSGGQDSEAFKAAMRRRHAGVLGMGALIGAYPYDVPAWLPHVLVLMAQHVVDPIPIKQTVRNIFGEFWRTHQDAWPMLKEKFTEDQLSALTNLLASPSYFS